MLLLPLVVMRALRTDRIVWGSAGLVCRQIESVTVIDLFGCDVCCFGGQSWHNVKTLRISVRVLRVVGRPVKCAGAEASSLDLVAPRRRIDV